MNLKFDKMAVDTTLAKTYLEQEYNSIKLCRPMDNLNACNNIGRGLLNLATKIKRNMDMLAQLECLQRNIPIEDSIVQIKLLLQQLYYVARQQKQVIRDVCITIVFENNDPLLNLGLLWRYLLTSRNCSVMLDKKTEPLCYFIIKHCQDEGLPAFPDTYASKIPYTYLHLPPLGTIGVISENSDVDSAVDVFLTSSTQVPWRLQMVLVKESVYKHFKDTLTWKFNLNKQCAETSDASRDAIQYNGRTFLLDAVGPTEPDSNTVAVGAYRTTKELKSLLNINKHHCLSLWANDIAEINEITHSVDSPVVWVNNFGDFRGPAEVSQAIYSYEYRNEKFHKRAVCDVIELNKAWLALNIDDRRKVLCTALDEIIVNVSKDDQELCEKIKIGLEDFDTVSLGTFIEVDKDYVCLGVNNTRNQLFNIDNCDYILSLEFFKALLLGCVFVVNAIPTKDLKVLSILENHRIPALMYDSSKYPSVTDNMKVTLWNCNINIAQAVKVIWTNSGTIFAN